MKDSTVLRTAQRILEERGLHKRDMIDPEGSGRVCAVGAVALALGAAIIDVRGKTHIRPSAAQSARLHGLRDGPLRQAAVELSGREHWRNVPSLNDLPETTAGDVRAWLHRAAQIAEATNRTRAES